jgi:hypothetical protein
MAGYKMKAALLAVVLAVLQCETAGACTIPRGLSADQRRQADSVFFGRIVRIDYAAEPGHAKVANRSATMTFNIHSTVRGRPVKGAIKVYGFSNIGTQRISLEEFVALYGRDVYVGIIFPETIKSHTSCREQVWKDGAGKMLAVSNCRVDLPIVPITYEPDNAPRLDRPRVIEELCGDQFISKLLPSDLPPAQ